MKTTVELKGGTLAAVSYNPERARWEVWCSGIGEDFSTRTAAMQHVRRLDAALKAA